MTEMNRMDGCRWWVALSVAALLGWMGGLPEVAAQETESPAAATPNATPQEAAAAPQELESQLEAWASMEQQFADLEARLATATGDEATAIRASYQTLADQARILVDQIQQSAQSRLEADRTDRLALRTLMGILLEAAADDNDAQVLQLGDYLIGKGINPQYFALAAKSDRLRISQKELFDELLIRHAEAQANDLPRVKLITNRGEIVLELFEDQAPGTVGNFIHLVEQGYYNGLLFHRVIEGFMAQGGGYRRDAAGQVVGGEGPGYEILCECYRPDRRLHFSGSLSMAHRGPRDTGGAQFFLTLQRTDFLDDKHTVFGRVIAGADVLDQLVRTHVAADRTTSGEEEPIEGAQADVIEKAVVVRKRDHEYLPEKVTPAQ